MEVIKRSQKNSTKKSNRFHDFVQKNSCQEMPCPVGPDEPEYDESCNYKMEIVNNSIIWYTEHIK